MKVVALPSGGTFTLFDLDPNWRPRKRTAHARRKKREREAGSGWTSQEFAALCHAYGNRCLRCGEAKRLVPDHVIPLVSGGAHDLANIQPLCHACNLWKGLRKVDFR